MKRIDFTTAKLASVVFPHQAVELDYTIEDDDGKVYFIPFQSQLQDWLRNKHGIHVYIDMTTISNLPKRLGIRNWYCCIQQFSTNHEIRVENNGKYFFDTYEDALEAGLIQSLKIVIDAESNM